jgi:anion-transporting  ArsA/GET3 family ATPase
MVETLSRSQKTKLTKIAKIIAIILIVLTPFYLILSRRKPDTSQVAGSQTSTETITVAEALKTSAIGKQYDVPLTDQSGDEIAKLQFDLVDAELRDEILVKGSKATAVPGRQFLIINFKITNQSENGVNVNTKNYLRLSVNGNDAEWLAPDIHNDPVEVQAISTKRTRLGFPINESDTNLRLQFGQIAGNKEIIELQFN